MKYIILNIILVFLLMIHYSTAEENAQNGESDKLKNSATTSIDPVSYDEPEKSKEPDTTNDVDAESHLLESVKDNSFHDRLKGLPSKVITPLITNGEEIGKGVGKAFKGNFLEGTVQSFGGIAGLFKDGFTNTRHLIFGED